MFLANKLNKGSGGAAPDDKFNYVTMLLHGDGTNGAQNNTFLDSSTNNFTITRNGNTTQGSFSPYGSNWSNYFNDGAYLSIPNNAVFNPGSGDFTVEAMFCRTVNTGGSQTIIAKYETSWQSSYSIVIANNTWDVYITYGVGSYVLVYSGAAPAVGVWSHVALQRSGSYWEFYCNGVRLAQVTAYTIASTTSAIRIGELGSGYSGYSFNGHISNVRIRNGYATYSGSTYTVPTANLTAITGTVLLTCQSNRFIDNSSNNFTVTSGTVSAGRPSVQRFNPFGTSTAYSTSVIGGSGYFDGTDDWLTMPSNSAFDLGTGDFTVECWVYRNTSTSGYETMLGFDVTGGLLFEIYQNELDFGVRGTVNVLGSGVTVPSLQWVHLAITRQSGVVRYFQNGTLTYTYTGTYATQNFTNNGTAIISGYSTPGGQLNGYISNLRLVKGTALYTSSFTPSTTPLTAVSGTSLLTNFTNGAIFDNSMMNDLETVGNAQISTSVKKFGTGSMSFDGTGDYLSTRSTPNLAFGSGDFTIEAWVYATSLGSYNAVFAQWPDNGGSANNSYTLETVGSNMEFYWASSAGLHGPATLGTITTGVWIHYAICRSGNTLYPFKNGVLGTTISITQTLNSPTSAVTVGGAVAGGGEWIGYIDDLRITKGYARYTSTFTPPTAAFPNIGPV